MAGLPTSGQLSLEQIREFLGESQPISLKDMSANWGFSPPYSISQFHGFSGGAVYTFTPCGTNSGGAYATGRINVNTTLNGFDVEVSFNVIDDLSGVTPLTREIYSGEDGVEWETGLTASSLLNDVIITNIQVIAGTADGALDAAAFSGGC
jgi:hypothetical protein